jgi:hypothetical protein
MLHGRVQKLETQLEKDFRHNESMMARLIPFLRKEVVKKEAVEKEDDDEEEEDQEV